MCCTTTFVDVFPIWSIVQHNDRCTESREYFWGNITHCPIGAIQDHANVGKSQNWKQPDNVGRILTKQIDLKSRSSGRCGRTGHVRFNCVLLRIAQLHAAIGKQLHAIV